MTIKHTMTHAELLEVIKWSTNHKYKVGSTNFSLALEAHLRVERESSPSELSSGEYSMLCIKMKSDIERGHAIQKLSAAGYITEDEYEKYYLSEASTHLPKILPYGEGR